MKKNSRISYKQLLKKYMAHVQMQEGLTFVNNIRDPEEELDEGEEKYVIKFSAEEIEILKELRDEIKEDQEPLSQAKVPFANELKGTYFYKITALNAAGETIIEKP